LPLTEALLRNDDTGCASRPTRLAAVAGRTKSAPPRLKPLPLGLGNTKSNMATHRTAAEVEQEHLRAFGSELGPLYHALHNEVTWLYAKWLEYRKLFAKSDKRIDVLNDTAGFFFRVVQDTLWEDVLLGIARLTDPPKQGQFENLTLLRLPTAVSDSSLATRVRALANAAKGRSAFAREWRNKHIAHRDLSLAIDAKAEPLPGVSRQNVDDALASFAVVLNALQVHYLKSEVGFEHFVAHDDADALVYWLRVGLRSEQLQRKRLDEDRSLPEDFEPMSEA
jgi:hypothetical protein